MSEPPTSQRPDAPAGNHPGTTNHPGGNPAGVPTSWMDRRRDRIVAEIQRNRRGEYIVPTWVLAATLAAIVGAYALFLIFG